MKKQIKVLKEIYRSRGNITVNELVIMTELTKRQVYNALHDLKNRKLIIKKKESSSAKQHIPPKNKIYIEVNTPILKRIRELIK